MTTTLRYSLLDESLISARLINGPRVQLSLPALFVALAEDGIRDFPALRPHQRHPWHAFLVQLAAIALHQAGRSEPFGDEAGWRSALLALTPDDPDGAAWCLVSPYDRPAFLQSPEPGGAIGSRKEDAFAPDSIDILEIAKNHDLKRFRITHPEPEDWMYALISLQTAAPYGGGAGGYASVVRMNGGSSSRPGVALITPGGPGIRWLRDLRIALDERQEVADFMGYKEEGGLKLLWLDSWEDAASVPFASLDPFFIESCRRIRLTATSQKILAQRATTKHPRISKPESEKRHGVTGDIWTPVQLKGAKSLYVPQYGFDYKLMVKLIAGPDYKRPPAQLIQDFDPKTGIQVLARGISNSNSKTFGYHERRVMLTKKIRIMLASSRRQEHDRLASVAQSKVYDIGAVNNALISSLIALFDNAKNRKNPKDMPESIKHKAKLFAKDFERYEDARFFDGPLGLNEEIESEQPEKVRLAWYKDMAQRAEAILHDAFAAGPRSGEQRYRARAAALGRLKAGLRKELPTLAEYLDAQRKQRPPDSEHTPPISDPEPMPTGATSPNQLEFELG